MNWEDFLYLLLVSVLWGGTNPFLKAGAEASADSKLKAAGSSREGSGFLMSLGRELLCTFTNYKFIIPFAVNQMGSILFVYLLGDKGKI